MTYWDDLDALVAKELTESESRMRTPTSAKQLAQRIPISSMEWSIVTAMHSVCFPAGSPHKRFIRDLSENSMLTDRGRMYLAYLGHRYRRQWKATDGQAEWIIRFGEWVKA